MRNDTEDLKRAKLVLSHMVEFQFHRYEYNGIKHLFIDLELVGSTSYRMSIKFGYYKFYFEIKTSKPPLPHLYCITYIDDSLIKSAEGLKFLKSVSTNKYYSYLLNFSLSKILRLI